METILGVPVLYWIIMIASHTIHIYMKVEGDLRKNKIALGDYFVNKLKLFGLFIGLMQSAILLIAGYDALIKYQIKAATEPTYLISFVVAFLGYGGSSLWNNIMQLIENLINKRLIGDAPSNDNS